MVTIEPLAPASFELVTEWLAKPDINQWLTGEWRGSVSANLVAVAVRNQRNRIFLTRHDGVAVGLVALSNIEVIDKNAMIWYLLGKQELRGNGIATEAVKQLADLVFNETELASLYAWVMEGNVASRKVLEKAGFREVGRIRRASSFGGHQVDRIYFDLIPSSGLVRT